MLIFRPRSETNADKKVTRYLSGKDYVLTDDPNEAMQTLSWYAREVFNSVGVLCHFLTDEREEATQINARYGLIAGLAHGLDKPLLIIAESNFAVPFDYKLLLRQYRDANQAVEIVREWLKPLEKSLEVTRAKRQEGQAQAQSTNQLRGLYLGQVVAEQESEELVRDYFVETVTYREAAEGKCNIFIGRKGTGKSATLYKLEYELSEDPKCFVCLVKPEDYELSGLLRVISNLGGIDTSAYALQSLWKYLLLSEMAVQLYKQLERRPAYAWSTAEVEFMKWMAKNDRVVRGDFATRLEDAIASILEADNKNGDLLQWRDRISEHLHGGPIRGLQNCLQSVLREKSRVAILIDNLDRAWDTNTNINQLADFVVALLNISSSLPKIFERRAVGIGRINLTLTIFLRSDIFHRIRHNVMERDKVIYKKIDWNDRELLLRVIDDRYAAQREAVTIPGEFWETYFENPDASKLQILNYIYMRPRDLLFCVKSALETATNRAQPKVREVDIDTALMQYSRFALDSVVTESKVTGFDIETIANEFICSRPYLSDGEVNEKILNAGVPTESVLPIIRELCLVGFLGLRVSDSKTEFIDDIDDYNRIRKLANQYAAKRRRPVGYMIRRAFWPFLEVDLNNEPVERAIRPGTIILQD